MSAIEPQSTRPLAELESMIERGLSTFIEVGQALLEIRSRRLYNAQGFKTFEDYCRERWRFSRQHAARLIESALVAQVLTEPQQDITVSPIGDTVEPPSTVEYTPVPLPMPTNEGQARELAKIEDPAEMRAAWHEVIEQHGPNVTAAKVHDVVQMRRDPERRQQVRAEVAEGERLLAIVGDPEGRLANAAVKTAYSRGVSAVREMMSLHTDAVADVLSNEDRQGARVFIRDCRTWLDSLEQQMSHGIRLIQGED